MKRIKEIVSLNQSIFGCPALIDKNNLDDNFYYDSNNKAIVNLAISYFDNELEFWSVPAKNYFVRICLACHLSECGYGDFYDLLNDNDILPYDDNFSPPYIADKESYDKIIGAIKKETIKNRYGYKKTIEIFQYLYDDILKPVTIGYNSEGQDFFDLISFKKKNIIEYYFSLFHKMRQMKLDPNKELRILASCNKHGIPGNLLLNTPNEDKEAVDLIQKVQQQIQLRSVSVLTLESAKLIRKKYPNLLIHLSTHGSFNLNPKDYSLGLIDVLNVSEPWYLKQQDIIEAAKKNGVKIKYIINRGCLINKWENMSAILKGNIRCNEFGDGTGVGGPLSACEHKCCKLVEKYPWLALAYVSIQKEYLAFNKDIDIVKISTRDNPLDETKALLDYWTTYKPTSWIGDIQIKNRQAFVDWVKFRATKCHGICAECMACKDFYEEITGKNET